MLVGTVIANQGLLFNCVALLDGGQIVAIRQKRELPNYGTFDEKRLFAPGPLPDPVEFRGVKLGLPICEDIWFPFVTAHLADKGAQIFINVNGSPYEVDKDDFRLNQVCATRVRETGVGVIYLNRVGGQDELVFDGASFILNADGDIAHRLPDWGKRWWSRTGRPTRRMVSGAASRAKSQPSTSIRPISTTPCWSACVTM